MPDDPKPEMPAGCLGCNHDEVTKFLTDKKIDLERFAEVPEPRHAWNDINRCNQCGRCWLIMPAKTKVEPACVKCGTLMSASESTWEKAVHCRHTPERCFVSMEKQRNALLAAADRIHARHNEVNAPALPGSPLQDLFDAREMCRPKAVE
jgi:hypothetical protein